MKKSKIVWLLIGTIVFMLGLWVGTEYKRGKGKNIQTYSIGNKGVFLDEAGTQLPITNSNTIKDKEDFKSFLKIEDCIFMNMQFTRKMKVTGKIKNTSPNFVFKDVLLEATFFDKTGTQALHTSRFYVDVTNLYYEFEELVKFPLSVVKSDVGKVEVKILDFQTQN